MAYHITTFVRKRRGTALYYGYSPSYHDRLLSIPLPVPVSHKPRISPYSLARSASYLQLPALLQPLSAFHVTVPVGKRMLLVFSTVITCFFISNPHLCYYHCPFGLSYQSHNALVRQASYFPSSALSSATTLPVRRL